MSPTTITLEVSSPEQAALLQQFHGLLQELEQLAMSVPPGQVVDLCEAAVLHRSQEVNRQVLQQVVQQRIDTLEKKGRRCEPAAAVGPGKTAARAGVNS